MSLLTKIEISILLVIFSIGTVFSQSFSVGTVITSDFPKLHTTFLALDKDNSSYFHITPSNFLVIDNGKTVPENKIRVLCNGAPISVVLVFDVSRSMSDEIDGMKIINLVKAGARNFINEIDFSNGSRVAITAFAGRSYLLTDFTNDRDLLHQTINNINVISGTTNFNVAFLNETPNANAGAIDLLNSSPANHQRIIVFLTDGRHESMSVSFKKDIIASRLASRKIKLHAITFLDKLGINPHLSDLAEKSGGKYYLELNPNGLKYVYTNIINSLKNDPTCTLLWEVEPPCNPPTSNRQVNITFLRQDNANVSRSYNPPTNKYYYVNQSHQVVSFDNPDLGKFIEKSIKITPRQSNLSNYGLEHNMLVYSSKIVNSVFFEIVSIKGNGKEYAPEDSFIIPENEVFTYTIRFTPKYLKELRQSTLRIEAFPCPVEVPLIGGQSNIIITEPVLGDVFSACDKIKIRWAGIELSKPVNIDFTSDNGETWKRIASGVTGGLYTWQAPSFTAEYRFRVTEEYFGEYKWAYRYGASKNDYSTSIAIQENGLYFYISGFYQDKISFGDKLLLSKGNNDAFIAKFDINANPIWAINIGGAGDDKINGLALDPDGNVFITGSCYADAQFGSQVPKFYFKDKSYLFLAKYSNTGLNNGVKIIGSTYENPNVEFIGEKIKYIYNSDPTKTLIYVKGVYRGIYSLPVPSVNLKYTFNWTPFVAIFDLQFNLIDLYAGTDNTDGYSDVTTYDISGFRYNTGSFLNTRSYPFKTLYSSGGQDIYIDKYGSIHSSTAESDPINVIMPKLDFVTNELFIGDCILGDTLYVDTEFILTNNCEIPITIKNIYLEDFIGNAFWQLNKIPHPDNPNIEIIENIGTVLHKGDSISFRLKFAPEEYRNYYATLVIVPDCGYNAKLRLKSAGACKGLVVTPIEFEPTYLGEERTITQVAIVCNPNNISFKILPVIKSSAHSSTDVHWHYFTLEPPVDTQIEILPDSCITLTVKFKPTQGGLKTAFIDYNVGMGCKVPHSYLTGYAIKPEVTVNSIDWQEQRVNGSYKAQLIITNPNNTTETIYNFAFSDEQDGLAFNLKDLPQTPFQIHSKDSLVYDIWFEPIEEKVYNTDLILTVSNQNDASGNLKGVGILPKMEIDWICSSPIIYERAADVFLTIKNTSQTANLHINSIELTNTDEYNWKNGLAPSNIIIPKGGEHIFEILLTALDGAEHITDVVILADDYDGKFTEEWRTTISKHSCDILTIDLNKLNFNNILICDEHKLAVTITNTSQNTPLTLYSNGSYIIGTDADWFAFEMNEEIIIQPNEQAEIYVIFSPTEPRVYSVELFVSNSANMPIFINLSGKGVPFELLAENNDYMILPGKNHKQNLTIAANLPLLENVYVTEFEILIQYNSFAINFDLNSFTSLINLNNNENWIWDVPRYEIGGNLYISGSGQLQTPFNERALFMLDIYAYLSEYSFDDLNFIVNYNCIEIEHLTIPIEIEEICAYDLRIVKVGANEFTFGTPNPNPSSTNFSIEYSIGYDIPTTIKIYDIMGNELETILDTVLSGGTYNLTVTTENIPSGIYYIQINSGHFTETRQVNIVK